MSNRNAMLEFSRRPSSAAYMVKAFLPSPGFAAGQGFPEIGARWRAASPSHGDVSGFSALTGLAAGPLLSVVFPHAWTFRLQMAVLTHPAYPLPIWNALQIRNHLLQHAPMRADGRYDLETRVTSHRVLDKGLEVDLHTTMRVRADLVWEGLTTFYYRRRLGGNDAQSVLASAPETGAEEVRRWRVGEGSGWRFGRLTGDFNGLHWSNRYARAFGFRRAFQHPQRVLGQCLARLPGPLIEAPQRLDAWLKGPVFYGSEVEVRSERRSDAQTFALYVSGDERPAIIARWGGAGTDAQLIDDRGSPRPHEV